MKKKIVVAAVLLASCTAVAFASFNHNKKRTCSEKKAVIKPGSCTRTCPFS